jgi:hypothetical protein
VPYCSLAGSDPPEEQILACRSLSARKEGTPLMESLPIRSYEYYVQTQTGSLRRVQFWLYGDPVPTAPAVSTFVAPKPQYALLLKKQSDSDSTSRTTTIKNTIYTNLHLEVKIDEDLNAYAARQALLVAPQIDEKERERQKEWCRDLTIDVGLVVLTACFPVGVFAWIPRFAGTLDALSTVLGSGVLEWVTEETIEQAAKLGFETLMEKGSKMAIDFGAKAVVNVYKSQDVFNDETLVPAERTLLAIHRFKCKVDPKYVEMVKKMEQLRMEWMLQRNMQGLHWLGY